MVEVTELSSESHPAARRADRVAEIQHIPEPVVGSRDVLSKLRRSWVGVFYLRYLRRFSVARLAAVFLWRNGYPIYMKVKGFLIYLGISGEWIPLEKITGSPVIDLEQVYTIFPAVVIEENMPAVYPDSARAFLKPPHDRYDFPPSRVFHVSDADVIGGSNLVTAHERVIFHELYDFDTDSTSEELHARTYIDPGNNRICWQVVVDPAEYLPAAASFVDACAGNYAHWMTEVLPRISIFCDQQRYKYIPIIIDEGLHPNQIESLLSVVDTGREIIALPRNAVLHVETLSVVSPSGYVPFDRRKNRRANHSHGVFSPYAITSLANKVSQCYADGSDTPEKIYIRRNSRVRCLDNQDEVEEHLVDRGFAVVEPEKYSFGEQVRMFSDANVIVGATGAALANIIFCKPGTKIIIMIANHEKMPFWYWVNMAATVRCEIVYVVGEIRGASRLGIHSNFAIELNDLFDAIDR